MSNNTQDHIEITQDGLDELTSELRHLEEEKIPNSIKRVATARSYGDLSENAEYHDAKEELDFLETRKDEITIILAKAKVVKATRSQTKIGIGSTVVVQNLDTKKKVTYNMVGEFEADPIAGKISVVSPLGKALAGKKKDDEVQVAAPAGSVAYKILELK